MKNSVHRKVKLVTIGAWVYPETYRTRKSSACPLMVLGGRPPGRVRNCQLHFFYLTQKGRFRVSGTFRLLIIVKADDAHLTLNEQRRRWDHFSRTRLRAPGRNDPAAPCQLCELPCGTPAPDTSVPIPVRLYQVLMYHRCQSSGRRMIRSALLMQRREHSRTLLLCAADVRASTLFFRG